MKLTQFKVESVYHAILEVFALQNSEFPNLRIYEFTNLQAMQLGRAIWLPQ